MKSPACRRFRVEAIAGFTDIIYEKCDEGIAKITINRPEVRNAFRPKLSRRCRPRSTMHATTPRSASSSLPAGKEAFCSGGDQRVRAPGLRRCDKVRA